MIYSGHMKDVISRIFPDLLQTLPINSINTWDLRKPRLGSLFPRKDETEHNLVNWSINKYKDTYLSGYFSFYITCIRLILLNFSTSCSKIFLKTIFTRRSFVHGLFLAFGSFLAIILSVSVQTGLYVRGKNDCNK